MAYGSVANGVGQIFMQFPISMFLQRHLLKTCKFGNFKGSSIVSHLGGMEFALNIRVFNSTSRVVMMKHKYK